MDIQKHIQKVIDEEAATTLKSGMSKLDTCDARHWDQLIWNYKEQIIETLRKRGFTVNTKRSFGVTTIVTLNKVTFK